MGEILVTCVLMITVMGFITTNCVSANRVWKDIGQRRIAVCELSNHLDSITQLNVGQATEAIAALEPSSQCATVLRSPVLAGKLVTDNLGTRIELQLDWKRRFPGKPVILSGWLINTSPSSPEETGKEANEEVKQE